MNRLRQLRHDRGLTADQLARIINLTASAVRNIERDEIGFSVQSLERACDYFGVSTDYMLCRSNDIKQDKIPDSYTNKQLEVINNKEFTDAIYNSIHHFSAIKQLANTQEEQNTFQLNLYNFINIINKTVYLNSESLKLILDYINYIQYNERNTKVNGG